MTAAAPFPLQLLLDRVAATCKLADGSRFHLVDYAADQAQALATRQIPTPAALILEPSYQATSDQQGAAWGVLNVPHDYELGILTVVQNFATTGALGGRSQSVEAERLRGYLWANLLGWSPEDMGFVLDMGRGQLVDYDETVFMYLDTFTLRRVIRA